MSVNNKNFFLHTVLQNWNFIPSRYFLLKNKVPCFNQTSHICILFLRYYREHFESLPIEEFFDHKNCFSNIYGISLQLQNFSNNINILWPLNHKNKF